MMIKPTISVLLAGIVLGGALGGMSVAALGLIGLVFAVPAAISIGILTGQIMVLSDA
jgi:hypothetical protein